MERPYNHLMQITKEWLTYWFTKFNADYFGGELPLPRFGLSQAATRLGSFSCKRRRRLLRTELYDFAIRLSIRYDLSEREYQQTLLHEMIHYHIAYHGLRDTSPHGQLFRKIMSLLNSRYGWQISVSSRLTPAQRATAAGRGKTYLVLAMELNDGRCFLTVVNERYSKYLGQILRMVPNLKDYRWLRSQDTYFASFPAVRSLRMRRVERSVYERFAR